MVTFVAENAKARVTRHERLVAAHVVVVVVRGEDRRETPLRSASACSTGASWTTSTTASSPLPSSRRYA